MRSIEFNKLGSFHSDSEGDKIETNGDDGNESLFTTYKAYIVVIASFTIQLGVGWHAVFGNYLPYFASLMTYKNINPLNDDINYIEQRYSYYTDEIAWTYSIWVITYSLTMGLGGKIEYKFGPKLVILLGSIFTILGLILTFLVLEYSSNPYLLYLSYGAMTGCGAGLLFTTPYLIGMRWFENENKKGLISGIIMSGISWSAMSFNLLSTQFVNPNNIKIDQKIGFIRQQNVLHNIPISFLKFAFICFWLFTFGILFIQNPPQYVIKIHETHTKKKKLSMFSDYDMNSHLNDGDKQSLITNETLLNKDDTKLTSIKSILCEVKFWNLFFTVLVLPVTYVYSQWKEFNNKYLGIENDQLLSFMVSASTICDGVSKLVWGYLFDKILHSKHRKNRNGYKILMFVIALGCIAFIATWTQLKRIENHILLMACAFVWLIVLYVLLSGALTLLPIQTAHIYGTQQGGIVYGLCYCARIAGTIFSMTAVIQTRQLLGWQNMNNFWVATQCILLLLVWTSKSK